MSNVPSISPETYAASHTHLTRAPIVMVLTAEGPQTFDPEMRGLDVADFADYRPGTIYWEA